jgi:hypothetical protein
MVIARIDPNPQRAGPVTQWTKAYWEAVHPFDLGGAYPNFMMDDESDATIKATMVTTTHAWLHRSTNTARPTFSA